MVDLRAEAGDDERRWGDGVVVIGVAMVDHAAPRPEALEAAALEACRAMRAGETVYIHCHAGIERGPTVAIAALVASGWPLADAYRLVREKRPRVAPTAKQMAVLTEFAKRHGAMDVVGDPVNETYPAVTPRV